jgi:hypothetical protein
MKLLVALAECKDQALFAGALQTACGMASLRLILPS